MSAESADAPEMAEAAETAEAAEIELDYCYSEESVALASNLEARCFLSP